LIYEAQCRACGNTLEYVSSPEHCLETPPCPKCGALTDKVILTAPAGVVKGQFEAFKGVDGRVISNQVELDRHNKEHNLVNLHDGYDEKAILSGKIGEKAVEEKKTKKKDVEKAVTKVVDGYKPKIEVHDE